MKGTSKNSQICPQRAAVRCNAATDLFRISSPRRNAEPVITHITVITDKVVIQVSIPGRPPLQEPRISVRCRIVLVSKVKQGGYGNLYVRPCVGRTFLCQKCPVACLQKTFFRHTLTYETYLPFQTARSETETLLLLFESNRLLYRL